jgi:S1-C subfamily serine protease
MKTMVALLLAALAVTQAYAADEPPEDTEQRLQAARERLEDAAREVAEISAEIGAPLVDRLMAFGGGPQRAIIGVQLDPASGKDGARIIEVSPGGPAAEAGLKKGDVIVSMNGKDLKGTDKPVRELSRRMRDIEPESKVKLQVLREGKARDFEVTTRSWHGVFAARALPPTPGIPAVPEVRAFPPMDFDFMHALRGELSGMELATLTPKLGEYFGTQKGVLVVRAPEGDAFKLQDGDVIVGIDGREPKNGSHATRILRSYQPGEKVKLRVMRQKRAVDLDVTLPEAAPKHRRVRMLAHGEVET